MEAVCKDWSKKCGGVCTAVDAGVCSVVHTQSAIWFQLVLPLHPCHFVAQFCSKSNPVQLETLTRGRGIKIHRQTNLTRKGRAVLHLNTQNLFRSTSFSVSQCKYYYFSSFGIPSISGYGLILGSLCLVTQSLANHDSEDSGDLEYDPRTETGILGLTPTFQNFPRRGFLVEPP